MVKKITATNWNVPEDFYYMAWNQQLIQFWLDTEFNVSKDINTWSQLSEAEQDTYKKVLTGLTALDTLQGTNGMSLVTYHSSGREAAVFSLFQALEQIHAKSYSTIFTTLISSQETEYLLNDFVSNNEILQYKGQKIKQRYDALLKENPSKTDLYMARVASAFLESFLFYSGFFYPLYLGGQGKVTTSAEIIKKILLDETVHGNAVGFSAQQIYDTMTQEEQEFVDREMYQLLNELYDNEVRWCHEIYDQIGLTEEVLDYVRYNANRALTNLGKDHYFEHRPINPIILNQTDVNSQANHDFFSQKGSSYVQTTKTEELSDDDFFF